MSICIGGRVLMDSITCSCGNEMKQDGDRFDCEKCGDVVSGYNGLLLYNWKDKLKETK